MTNWIWTFFRYPHEPFLEFEPLKGTAATFQALEIIPRIWSHIKPEIALCVGFHSNVSTLPDSTIWMADAWEQWSAQAKENRGWCSPKIMKRSLDTGWPCEILEMLGKPRKISNRLTVKLARHYGKSNENVIEQVASTCGSTGKIRENFLSLILSLLALWDVMGKWIFSFSCSKLLIIC